MTDKLKNPMTDALRGAIERIAEENGFVFKPVGEAVWAEIPEPFGTVAKLADGTFLFTPLGEESKEPVDQAVEKKAVWIMPPHTDRVTSPEVATLAAKGLKDPASLTPEEIKAICASCVAQA